MSEIPPGFKPEAPTPALNPEALKTNPTFVAWNRAREGVLNVKAATEQGITHSPQLQAEDPALTQALNDKRDNAAKAALAINDVRKAWDEKKYNPNTGEYEVTLPDGKTETRNYQDTIPGFIDALEIGASLERDLPPPGDQTPLDETQAKKKALADEAKTALTEFTSFVQVDGVSYADYQKRVEEKAREKSGAQSDADWNALGADDRDAFTYQARQELGGKFSLKFEKPQLKSEEPKASPETEKPEDRLMRKAKDVAREIQTQNGAVDTMSQEELDKIPPNEDLARLEIFLLAAENASGPQREYFLAAIYEELQNPGLTAQLSEITKTELTSFLQSKEIAGDRFTPGVAYKGRQAFIHNVIVPLLRSNFPQEYTTFEHELDNDQVFRNFFLGLHFQGRKATPADIRLTLNAQMREGLTFTAGDTALIQAIADKDNSEMIEAVLTGMGLDVKELKNLPLYGETHAAKIVDLVATPEEKTSPDWETSQVRNNRITVTKKHFTIAETEIKKKRRWINEKFLMSFGAAVMILTMFQNTLGFGVFSEEQQQGGH